MSILYHLTIPPPQRPACEAISQEITALRSRLDGDVVYLNPNRHLPIYVPRLLFGFHKLRQLHTFEASVDIHHLYNPDPFPFPILRLLRKPVIYSLTGGVKGRRINKRFFDSLAAVTVPDQESLDYLNRQGLNNVFLVQPGIDTDRFAHTHLPLRREIRLMVGSAPWTCAQFKSKGVDALLEAARRIPRLHLVFLWRGVLAEEMANRVHGMGLVDRVEIINRIADVNKVLARVHASAALAAESDIVRAYPHSLMESLAAGKPVLVSRPIPMASYVKEKGCGVVVERVNPAHIIAAVEALEKSYSDLQTAAERTGQRDFSQQRMIDSYKSVYEHVLASEH
ncbi:MAG: glycosyltransferase [bacterium]